MSRQKHLEHKYCQRQPSPLFGSIVSTVVVPRLKCPVSGIYCPVSEMSRVWEATCVWDLLYCLPHMSSCCLEYNGCWWKGCLSLWQIHMVLPPKLLTRSQKTCICLLYSLVLRLQDSARANACQLSLLHVGACMSSQHTSPADYTQCVICIVDTLVPHHLQQCLVVKPTVFSCIKTHFRSPPCHHTSLEYPLTCNFPHVSLLHRMYVCSGTWINHVLHK